MLYYYLVTMMAKLVFDISANMLISVCFVRQLE
jgi:hypothetical protein